MTLPKRTQMIDQKVHKQSISVVQTPSKHSANGNDFERMASSRGSV